MGMPVVVEIADKFADVKDVDDVFEYLRAIDERFSTYKELSEISRINRGEILPDQFSVEMKNILSLCEKTKQETEGFFDINFNGLKPGTVSGHLG